MALIQVWPKPGLNVRRENGVGFYTPAEYAEHSTYVSRRLEQEDLYDYDPTGVPYYPFIDEQSVVQGRVGTDLDTLRGRNDGATTLTTGRNSEGDGNGANFTWDDTSVVARNGTTIFGLGAVGRWIQTGTVGGGTGSSFTGPSVAFTASGTINTTGIADAAYFAIVPTSALIARGLTPPTTGANINVRHAFNNSNFTLTVPHEDTGASATARFATDDALPKAWPPKTWMTFAHDATATRYRVRQEADPRSLLYTDLVNTAIRSVGEVRQIHGRVTLNDGGEGYFRAVSSSGLTIDGGIVSASATSGYYWQRIYRPSYVSAKWFGASNGNTTLGTIAAISAASAGSVGGNVHLPRGLYLCDALATVSIPSNISVYGDGRDTIWRRPNNSNGAYGAFNVFGTSGVRVKSFTIECENWINFIRVIDAYDDGSHTTTDLVVDGMRIQYTDAAYAAKLASVGGDESLIFGHYTMHAVLLDNSYDCSVINCSFKYMQAKLATFGSAIRLRYENNYSDDPLDFAFSVVSSGATPGTRDFIGIKVNNNFVNNPRASGTIFVGADAETGQTRYMEDVQVHGNTVRQNYNLAGFQILVHLANASKNVSICNNNLVNKFSPLSGNSYLIRVRCTEAVKRVENLMICGNLCDGADHAGIGVDVNGQNVIISNNLVSRSRGIYVVAANGNLDGVVLSGNICSDTTNSGYYVQALTGSITNLIMSDCVATDILSFSSVSSGAWFEATSGKSIAAVVRNFRGKKKDSNNPGQQLFWQFGAGTMVIEYVDCDATEWLNFVDLDCGIALGHDNKGYGAPDFETITIRTPDVAGPSDTDALARCWGKVKYAKFRLSAALTTANSVMTYKCETAVGSGTFNTLTGTVTVLFSGSDEGQTYWQTLSGSNDIVPRAKIRASCDGGATSASGLDVIGDTTLWIDRAA